MWDSHSRLTDKSELAESSSSLADNLLKLADIPLELADFHSRLTDKSELADFLYAIKQGKSKFQSAKNIQKNPEPTLTLKCRIRYLLIYPSAGYYEHLVEPGLVLALVQKEPVFLHI